MGIAEKYAQALKDHEYLWTTYEPANDMTGGYVDSEDLKLLLRNPTKTQAYKCLAHQISYWFEVGPERDGYSRIFPVKKDPELAVIAERYKIEHFHWTVRAYMGLEGGVLDEDEGPMYDYDGHPEDWSKE